MHFVVIMITVFGAMQQLVNNIRLIPHQQRNIFCVELFSAVTLYQNK